MSAFGGKADKYERCGISPLHVGTVTGTGRVTVAATALFRPCPHKSRQHNARNDGTRDHQNRREIKVHRLSLFALESRKIRYYSRSSSGRQMRCNCNIVSFPCEHFSVAQDTLSGSRFPGGTFGFDHLVDGAAVARDSEVGHGRKHPFSCAITISLQRRSILADIACTVLSGCCQARLRIGDVAS
jgi:hypothetical protein